jgi:hypothetical protein
MQTHRTAQRTSQQTASLALALALAFVLGALMTILCWALRGSLSGLTSSTVTLPLACIAGAGLVRGIEWLFSSLVRSARAQRSGTA